MPNWLEHARNNLAKTPAQPTAKTAETQVVSVLAVAATEDNCKKAWLNRWLDARRSLMVKRDLDENTAAREASQWILVEWMNQQKAEQPDISICGHCSQPLTGSNNNPGLPFLNVSGGHVWVHRDCHCDWMTAREARAKTILQAYGVVFLISTDISTESPQNAPKTSPGDSQDSSGSPGVGVVAKYTERFPESLMAL